MKDIPFTCIDVPKLPKVIYRFRGFTGQKSTFFHRSRKKKRILEVKNKMLKC